MGADWPPTRGAVSPPLALHIQHRIESRKRNHHDHTEIVPGGVDGGQAGASPFVLIDPSTGRAVEQPRPYWHWSNRVVEQEEEPTNLQADNDLDETEVTGTQQQVEPLGQSEQLVERAYVRPYTPYVHPRPQEPARSEYISETGTPLYKLRRRNPYGRK